MRYWILACDWNSRLCNDLDFSIHMPFKLGYVKYIFLGIKQNDYVCLNTWLHTWPFSFNFTCLNDYVAKMNFKHIYSQKPSSTITMLFLIFQIQYYLIQLLRNIFSYAWMKFSSQMFIVLYISILIKKTTCPTKFIMFH